MRNEAYHAYGDGYGGNSTEVLISGLKAGDKVKISVNYMQANIYGWQYIGNAWYAMDEYGNIKDGFDIGGDQTEIKSTAPLSATLGVVDYGTENTFTITISCKKDGVLTIEWNDEAGFYLEQMTFWDVSVLR